MPIIPLASSFLCSLSQCHSLRFFYSMLIIPDVIQLGSSFLCLLSRMLFGLGLSLLCSLSQNRILFFLLPISSLVLVVPTSRVNLFSMFITANVIRSLFHCLIGQFFNCSSKLGVKECNGMHSECSARRVPTLRK